ncbi:phosphotransferase [Streptomyces europaeiscabiei]|uniref:phosphotransferase n=1 Tax=Streptomyces europaeiscabiei TaxID=146819 RepID=UPI0038F74598
MIDITPDLVRALISAQFPDWSELPVRPVDRQGWDNRTFRLGDELTVRLPSAEGYAAAVAKEDRCLPAPARHLPLPVPEPVAAGRPGEGYPFSWSVRRWLPGDTVEVAAGVDRTRLARDLGAFLGELRRAPLGRGPAAGRTRTSAAAIPACTATRSKRPWSGWRAWSTSPPAVPSGRTR